MVLAAAVRGEAGCCGEGEWVRCLRGRLSARRARGIEPNGGNIVCPRMMLARRDMFLSRHVPRDIPYNTSDAAHAATTRCHYLYTKPSLITFTWIVDGLSWGAGRLWG